MAKGRALGQGGSGRPGQGCAALGSGTGRAGHLVLGAYGRLRMSVKRHFEAAGGELHGELMASQSQHAHADPLVWCPLPCLLQLLLDDGGWAGLDTAAAAGDEGLGSVPQQQQQQQGGLVGAAEPLQQQQRVQATRLPSSALPDSV